MKKVDTPLLVMENISKSFPGVRALNNARLTLDSGTVHALMGENGAGKSTLMKCLFGIYKMDGGSIRLEGRELEISSPKDALAHGIAMVHQELNQALTLSVEDNMWLGRFPRLHPALPFINRRSIRRRTREIFTELGIGISPETRMDKLSVSERQIVEIAKAVSYNAKVIVFDEPTSSLTEKEVERLFSIIDMLKKRGCGIIYISHKMEEILRISDKVTVMRDGEHIATENASELTTDKIISLMVGRELTDRFPRRNNTPGDVLFEAEGLSGEYSRLKDAGFTLRCGEVLGIAGLDGSGRTELLEAIFGLSKLKRGKLRLNGKRITNSTPREAKKNGFALLTEERRASGIFSILNIKENTTVSSLSRFSSLGIINDKKAAQATADGIRKMRIKTPNQKARIGTLSGGNQQKVILSRWLLTDPKVLMLDEPTRGIDVGAKYEIYTLINSLAEQGRGIIMVSSEMAELIGMSDRIIVMSGGRIAGEISREAATQEKIMEMAAKYA